LNLPKPVIQDDDWFLFWLDIIGLTKQCYDYSTERWLHLPFEGGVFEQADKNPYLWGAICYIISQEKKGRFNYAQSNH
jgi:hypothetical protein